MYKLKNTSDLKKRDDIDREKLVVITDLCSKEVILRAMKCSVCEKIPFPPISHCSGPDSHLLCKECASEEHATVAKGHCPARLQTHVICRSAIIPYGLKLYDTLFYGSFMTCPYSSRGCKDKFLGSARQSHLNICAFRPALPCPVAECKSKISPRLFTKHLISSHKVVKIDRDKATIHVLQERKEKFPTFKEDYRWFPAIFSCQGLDFILIAEETDTRIYLWILSGHPVDIAVGRQFTVRLALKTPKGKRKLTWTGDPKPLDCDMDSVRETENCLSILKKTVDKDYLFEDNGRWYFQVGVAIDEYFDGTYMGDENKNRDEIIKTDENKLSPNSPNKSDEELNKKD